MRTTVNAKSPNREWYTWEDLLTFNSWIQWNLWSNNRNLYQLVVFFNIMYVLQSGKKYAFIYLFYLFIYRISSGKSCCCRGAECRLWFTFLTARMWPTFRLWLKEQIFEFPAHFSPLYFVRQGRHCLHYLPPYCYSKPVKVDFCIFAIYYFI